MSKIEEIKGRWAAALPGPWHWSGFAKHPRVGSPRVALVTSHSGQKYIICADPDDGLMLRCPEGPGLAPAVEVAEHQDHNGVITGMKDPNATAIAAAPEDIRWLVERVDRLEQAIRDHVEAHTEWTGKCHSCGGFNRHWDGCEIQPWEALLESEAAR